MHALAHTSAKPRLREFKCDLSRASIITQKNQEVSPTRKLAPPAYTVHIKLVHNTKPKSLFQKDSLWFMIIVYVYL